MKNFTSLIFMFLFVCGGLMAQENEGIIKETVVKKTVVRTGDTVETQVVEETVKEKDVLNVEGNEETNQAVEVVSNKDESTEVVVDENGVIIAKNLRGAALEQKVAELLK